LISPRKLLKYWLYYSQVLLHRLNGKQNMDMRSNGEFNTLRRSLGIEAYVIDVGSHVGDWTYEATQIATGDASRFLAIDGNSALLEPLQQRFQGDKRVSVRHCAISDFLGKADFQRRDQNDAFCGSNSVYRHYYLAGGGSSVEIVDVVTLDAILSELGWPRIDFLKLDVEGSEVPALRGASDAMSRAAIRMIQIEYNQTWIKARTSLEDVFDICHKTGYQLYRILAKGLMSFEEYHYLLDDFVYANMLLVAPGSQLPLPVRKNTVPSFKSL